MFRLLLIVAFAGAVYGGGMQLCQNNQTNIDTINSMVNTVQSDLMSFFQNPTSPTAEELNNVLNAVCATNTPTYSNITEIAKAVKDCLQVIPETNLPSLQIGPVGFTDLFNNFQGIENFCECVPSLSQTLVMEGFYDMNMLTITNNSLLISGIPNYPVMCAPVSQNNPVALKDSIGTLYDHRITCGKVFTYNTFVTKDNIKVLKDMVGTCTANQTDISMKFKCTLDVSSTSGFKDCMNAATAAGSTTSDDVTQTPKCKRRICVQNYMATPCSGTMAIVYMHAVESKSIGFISLEDVCDSAVSVTVSITLMIIAALYSLFL